MNISFGQIYPEIDTAFNLTNTILVELKKKINDLNQSFSSYESIFKTNNYSAMLTISATRKNDTLIINGPIVYKKDKTIEFVLHIPYKQTNEFTEEMSYALDFIGQGLHLIFNDNKANSDRITKIIDEIKSAINENPEKYRKWTK
ncbi:hypothetical protein [Pseudomonas canadensis]|uniref:hypothetical protein n=1 Tax=Pseudomonas canadensis TaxID=915099 RepID=UPI003BA025C6